MRAGLFSSKSDVMVPSYSQQIKKLTIKKQRLFQCERKDLHKNGRQYARGRKSSPPKILARFLTRVLGRGKTINAVYSTVLPGPGKNIKHGKKTALSNPLDPCLKGLLTLVDFLLILLGGTFSSVYRCITCVSNDYFNVFIVFRLFFLVFLVFPRVS